MVLILCYGSHVMLTICFEHDQGVTRYVFSVTSAVESMTSLRICHACKAITLLIS
jgi:hypothetical protein